MPFMSAVFALFADCAPPRGGGTVRRRPDGLDPARGVLFSVVVGLASWTVIGALIALCTTQ